MFLKNKINVCLFVSLKLYENYQKKKKKKKKSGNYFLHDFNFNKQLNGNFNYFIL